LKRKPERNPAQRPIANSGPKPTRRLRAVFFGTSAFAEPSLRALVRDHDVTLAISQQDKPAGRGMRLTPTPVKAAAFDLKLPVITPSRLDAEAVAQVLADKPDVLVCVSYGKILPAALLAGPRMAALNIHPSALPRYRGATPMQAALLAGDETTAISIIWMSDRMDAGDIALQTPVRIEPDENFGALHDRLAVESAALLIQALQSLANDSLPRRPQDESQATYTKPIAKSDLELRFDHGALELSRRVRAYAPRPGAWMPHAGGRLKVLDARPDSEAVDGPPGSVHRARDGGALAATAQDALRLLKVVPEGKRPMTGEEFARSLPS
jgi:methionyl-tRNA formyltransferase